MGRWIDSALNEALSRDVSAAHICLVIADKYVLRC